ncbi:unnamed protein product, partial [Urochloa humidicola]
RRLAKGGRGIPAAVGSSSASGRGRCRVPDGLFIGNHQRAAAPHRWREVEGSGGILFGVVFVAEAEKSHRASLSAWMMAGVQ